MKVLVLLVSLSATLIQGVHAQSSCASDGQTTPLLLQERFISADCEACWNTPTDIQPPNGALSLDWIVPSDLGEAAPLSVAASRDALMRLQVLGQPRSKTQTQRSRPVMTVASSGLRVAHGLALGGYIGASIEFKINPRDQRARQLPTALNAYLVLVESIPAGSDGTPIARNLVRNVLWLQWNQTARSSKSESLRFYELRPLSIPQGATPERLRVLGWVQDAGGQVLSAAQSVCAVQTR